MKYKYKNEQENNTLNNYNDFFKSINSPFKDKIENNYEQKVVPPLITEERSILQKTYGVFLTFTKDVLLGSALFITASIGVGSIMVTSHMLKDKTTYGQPVALYEVTKSSDDFKSLTDSLRNRITTEDIVVKLKDSNRLNEVGRVQFKNGTMFATPLAQAVEARRLDTVTQLVNAGADINFLYEDQPLMLYKIHDTTLKDNNASNPKAILEETQITTYLMSKGLNWKADSFYLLKNTANSEIWRNFWINYLTKNEPEFLPTYKEILKSQLTGKDNNLIEELKWLDKNNFK